MPLDIAWFDAAGGFVSSATMTPCLSVPDADCARYGAAAAYTAAIEVPAGRLAELGIGPGSVLALGSAPAATLSAGAVTPPRHPGDMPIAPRYTRRVIFALPHDTGPRPQGAPGPKGGSPRHARRTN